MTRGLRDVPVARPQHRAVTPEVIRRRCRLSLVRVTHTPVTRVSTDIGLVPRYVLTVSTQARPVTIDVRPIIAAPALLGVILTQVLPVRASVGAVASQVLPVGSDISTVSSPVGIAILPITILVVTILRAVVIAIAA